MKDNYVIILLAIPLTLLIWAGMRIYLDPGKATRWEPATVVKDNSTENQAATLSVDNAPNSDMTARTYNNSDVSHNAEELQESAAETEHGLTVIYGPTDKTCLQKPEFVALIKVIFRSDSAAIKGNSLIHLGDMINAYHDCKQGKMSIITVDNNTGTKPTLLQRRLDEVRYHLLHMRVAKSDILLPEKL